MHCSLLLATGETCGAPIEAGAPLALCSRHLLEAYDWVVRDVGLTDRLPTPCPACGSRLGVRYPSGWLCALCEWKIGDQPDSDSPPPRVDVVYYLRFADRIKIGTSGNPRGRLTQLRHDELLALERGDRAREHARHVQFAASRYDKTEWFTMSDELLTHVAALREGVDDPWSQYSRWVSEAIARGH